MDCVPPWLSSNKQCYANITTYNYTKTDIGLLINENFMTPKTDFRLTKAEKMCKNPCMKMTNTLSLVADYETKSASKLEFRFKKSVRVERKVVVYTWFNFIIDVGSSLGLWLGLSALGILDLALEAFGIVRKWFKIIE